MNSLYINQRVLFRGENMIFIGQVMTKWRALDGRMKCVVERVDAGEVVTFITLEDNLEPLDYKFDRTGRKALV